MNIERRAEKASPLGAIVQSADIEVIPLRGVEKKLTAIPAGRTVTITCSPQFGLERTLEHTALAARAGYRVVPHLAARQVTGMADLRRFIGRLDAIGVTDLYVIGGDAEEPAGPYSSAADLLETLSDIEHRLTTIGVACYPEGHPKIADEALIEALLAKQLHADYMVSQLCFDADALARWLRDIRGAGIDLPLHIGLAPPMQTRKLLQLSLKIGVGSSIRYLTKQHGMVGNLLRGNSYQPEHLLGAIGGAEVYRELGIEAAHLFSFNQIDATVEWMRRLVPGTADYAERAHP